MCVQNELQRRQSEVMCRKVNGVVIGICGILAKIFLNFFIFFYFEFYHEVLLVSDKLKEMMHFCPKQGMSIS